MAEDRRGDLEMSGHESLYMRKDGGGGMKVFAGPFALSVCGRRLIGHFEFEDPCAVAKTCKHF